ncbi:L,D-transpeptidase Cds6 family protein [Caminibacter sp.]
MKILILFIISTFLFAQNVYDIYRYEGIKAAQKFMEKQLQSKDFWLQRLQNKDVKFGYFEKPTYILFCNKLTRKLDVYFYKNYLKHLTSFNNIIVGKLGDKQKEGDLKTPIGNYTLINRVIPGNTFYGPLAFVTSYPNLYDKLHHKKGYGIWIHGKPLDGERGDLSKGCIVLNNDEILYLNKLINYKKTVLEITQNPIYGNKEDIAEILALIYKWRDAWKKSDLKRYLSFYAKDFHRSNGWDLKRFIKYKTRVFNSKKGQKIKIFFKNIQITPYQNLQNKKIYKVEFYEEYYSPTYTFKGDKEIYLAKRDGKFKIIIEK